ncbi:MAG TPA: alpha/beta hydrolase [Candidatus Binatia bacterium]|nr:alpha/beta hydrolase [Candidatus Binatia bacterium]
MNKRAADNPADFIVPLNMNGLVGRMMVLPAPKSRSREILFIYGQHATIERFSGLIQELNKYGAVTVPDLPGFGGMHSLYKLDQKPTIDALADYLAAFVKLRYKRRRLTIAGLGFGFVVVTRMLQRYPDLAKRVDLLISFVGFAHKGDLKFNRIQYNLYLLYSRLLAFRLTAWLFHIICLRPAVLDWIYKTAEAKKKVDGLAIDEFDESEETEINLWLVNDARTWAYTQLGLLKLDNCRVPVDLPVWHVALKADTYFDQHLVEQHLKVIFKEYHGLESKLNPHQASALAEAKSAAPLMPTALRRVLASS